MRERMHASVNTDKKNDRIIVHLQHSLDVKTYDVPLTLKTYIPEEWKKVEVMQGSDKQQLQIQKDNKGNYILYNVNPNKGTIELSSLPS